MDEVTTTNDLDVSQLPDVVPANQQYQNGSHELTGDNLNGTVNPSSVELTGDVTYNNPLSE